MDNIVLSIIIPAYNVAPFIEECIDSVYYTIFNLPNHEIIVVNDGSSDDTLKIITKLKHKYQSILIYSQENNGTGMARNFGLSVAKGEYIYFLDPDDLLNGNLFFQAIDYIHKNQLDVFAFKSSPFKDHCDNIENKFLKDERFKEDKILKFENGYHFVSKTGFKGEAWWYVTRKDLIEKANLVFKNTKAMQDVDFTLNVFLNSKKICYYQDRLHYYRIWSNSAMKNTNEIHWQKVIYGIKEATFDFNRIKNNLNRSSPYFHSLQEIILEAQQRASFFLIIRFIKSKLPMDKLDYLIEELIISKSYPISYFRLRHKSMSVRFLVYIINRPFILKTCGIIFRKLVVLTNKLK